MTFTATIHETLRSGRTSKTIIQAENTTQLLEMIHTDVNKRVRAIAQPVLEVSHRGLKVTNLEAFPQLKVEAFKA